MRADSIRADDSPSLMQIVTSRDVTQPSSATLDAIAAS
jgi:hypothetical protein